MAPTLLKGYQALLAEANAAITTVPAHEAIRRAAEPDVVLVDVRDVRELDRDGRIPGAFHCPRGMLEFWIDPASPYAKPVFQGAKTFLFFCASGWRSALATKAAQDMGLHPVGHIEGGFQAWKAAGGAVDAPAAPRAAAAGA